MILYLFSSSIYLGQNEIGKVSPKNVKRSDEFHNTGTSSIVTAECYTHTSLVSGIFDFWLLNTAIIKYPII